AEREDEAKWTQRDVKDVATAEGLTIRLVSNIEKQLMVRDKMFQRYKDSHKYTSEHRFKSKCICMFQELDGVSVLLFVNYFKPAHLRTKVYHELLIAYFDFVKQRGFHTAHLWACPPLKGDDYILYCHPEVQKTPKSDRLRTWYVDMLVKAEEEGVVWQITNMYDDYWRNENTPCALPYFEGDYWVGLVEDLIEKLDAEKPKKTANKKGSKSHKRKNSDTKKTANKKSKSKKPKRRKTASGGEASGDEDEDDDAHEAPVSSTRPLTVKSLDTPDWKLSDPLMHKLGEVLEPMKDDFLVVKLVPCCRVCNTSVVQGTLWRDLSVKTEHGLNPKVVQTALCDGCYQKLKVVSVADPDEINDSEFFDTRQAFLSLCQGNHYQFDELRRAKHSSMMALYHLGNPNPNAYVYECNACTRDIVTGNRWHCHTLAEGPLMVVDLQDLEECQALVRLRQSSDVCANSVPRTVLTAVARSVGAYGHYYSSTPDSLQQQLMDDRRRAAVTQQYRQMQNERQQQLNQAQGDDPMLQA
ncbi:Histone acetyltransferase, partial [Phytophthora palmivora]